MNTNKICFGAKITCQPKVSPPLLTFLELWYFRLYNIDYNIHCFSQVIQCRVNAMTIPCQV